VDIIKIVEPLLKVGDNAIYTDDWMKHILEE